MDMRIKKRIANTICSEILNSIDFFCLDEANLNNKEKDDIIRFIHQKADSIRPSDAPSTSGTTKDIVEYYEDLYYE